MKIFVAIVVRQGIFKFELVERIALSLRRYTLYLFPEEQGHWTLEELTTQSLIQFRNFHFPLVQLAL